MTVGKLEYRHCAYVFGLAENLLHSWRGKSKKSDRDALAATIQVQR